MEKDIAKLFNTKVSPEHKFSKIKITLASPEKIKFMQDQQDHIV